MQSQSRDWLGIAVVTLLGTIPGVESFWVGRAFGESLEYSLWGHCAARSLSFSLGLRTALRVRSRSRGKNPCRAGWW